MNSGEHQKVWRLKSVSNTPALAVCSASSSRSALACISVRASSSASSWRLRLSMSSTRPTMRTGLPSSSVKRASISTQRVSPSGVTMRMSSGLIFPVAMPSATCRLALAPSSGWTIGHSGEVASSKVMPRPTTVSNSGEHQKVPACRSVSNTPARAVSSARLSRSAFHCASSRASISASSWRLRSSMSSSTPTTFSSLPSGALCTTERMSIQRLSPEGSISRHSCGPTCRVSCALVTDSSTVSWSSGWTVGQTLLEASS